MDKLIGKRLEGVYEIEELIGEGGMANVYKARDLRNELERTVSVKVLREEYINDKDLVNRFKNESKAISLLNHENIVKVYDVSVGEKLQYIVMEYIDGMTLRDYLNKREGKLSWKETVHFISQILYALQHAHQNGVVHRDIKPQNIMLLPNGDLKMMDFGIARISRAENQLPSGKAMGSVHYISPEQAKGDVTDAKSDIYSVGIMMYEMLSGKLPFSKGTVVELALKQISEKPVSLAQLAPEAPHALVEITERAMAKAPEDRFQSVAEMLFAIDEFKLDPNISFEYKYMTDSAPNKVINKVMNKKPQTTKKKKTTTKVRRRSYFIPILFGVTIAFSLGCAYLANEILVNSNNHLFSEKIDVILEDFVGLSVSEVEDTPQYEQLDIIFEEEYNSSVLSGTVYKQSPASGRTVKEDQQITLTISLGAKYIEIEDYTNMDAGDVEQHLRNQGAEVLVIQSVEPSIAVGGVIRTEPSAGNTIAAGETVYIYVSRTAVQTTTSVPDVLGLTIEDARTLFTQKRIFVSSVTEIWHGATAGTVVEQSVAAGTTVKINSGVAITVSKGPEPAQPVATPVPATPEPSPSATPTTPATSTPAPATPTPAPATPAPATPEPATPAPATPAPATPAPATPEPATP